MPGDAPMPGFTDVRTLLYSRVRPWVMPKKSPSGTSTDGESSPSHQHRRIASRWSVNSCAARATYTRVMHPGPATSSNVARSPAPIRMKSSLPPERSQDDVRCDAARGERRRFPSGWSSIGCDTHVS